ncbi:UDP-N-acetylglucosamine 2-epimerase (non-hydrolyzing) [Candidatus Marinimicrobia bacterium]|nr:UDP-N-acetylglucosamine 2-epimerase (non-hydrolyzing) [Candidatus Neomarinimicrobiota bacterium]
MKNITIIVGARPNFMKVAPLLRLLDQQNNYNITLVHTGQHYDEKMSDVFFKDLDIRKPDYNLNVGSASHSVQTARIMEKFELVCQEVSPNLLIVVGDVNSTMACSIVAKKLHIKVAHIEAGLRSYDRDMPEEINRLITDSITDFFFVTEQSGEDNLIREGHDKNNIFFVGNLMIDSLHYGLNKIRSKEKLFDEEYGLITLHRPSNVDDIKKLKDILEGLSHVSNEIKLFFSIHPRTKKKMEEYGISPSKNIEVLDSMPYLDFLQIMKNSKVIFTDSGGIQEETTALKIPCYTLRENTERPVTISQGSNRLIGSEKINIINSFKEFKFDINSSYELPNGWDGNTSQRILQILNKRLK